MNLLHQIFFIIIIIIIIIIIQKTPWLVGRPIFISYNGTPYEHCFYVLLTGLEYPADLLKFEVCSDSLFFRFWVTSWISLSLYEIQKNKRFWVTSWVSLSLYDILKDKCPLIQFLNIHVSSWNDGFFTQFHS